MRRMLLVALVSLLSGLVGSDGSFAPAHAQDRRFPYEALVDVEGEYVRSGPGPNFYPTDKLKRGEKLMVHRHDPGGWCMIAPPAGSFSWIRAEHVQKSGDDRGVLKANKVVVHVGSSLNPDEFTTIQGNLSKGDAVEIIGEKTFPFDDGPKLMYKISPIKREWRWIPRKSIVAADAVRSEPFPAEPAPRPKKPTGPVADNLELDPDAFAKPISTGPTPVGNDEPDPRRAKPKAGETGASSKSSPTEDFRVRLDGIDQQFREMIQQEPSTWDLKGIAQQYKSLEQAASQPTVSNTIALRLDAVARYEKVHNEYVEFLKVTTATKQRDAQLASLQQQHEAQLRQLGGQTASTSPTPMTGPQPGPTPSNNAGSAPANTPAKPTQFAGAGLVQPMSRTFAGGPQFALIAPDGKLLSYLQPTAGIDLRRYAGHAMGIIGDRQFRQDWGADTITVRGLQPVQLRAGR